MDTHLDNTARTSQDEIHKAQSMNTTNMTVAVNITDLLSPEVMSDYIYQMMAEWS